MEELRLLHMHPTMEMIVDALTRDGLLCALGGERTDQTFSSAQLYEPGMALRPDCVYVLGGRDAGFPVDDFAHVGPSPAGKAAHIRCDAPPETLLNRLLALLAGFQAQERALDELVFRNEDLQALCELGAKLLDNPICIHDDWFVMIAKSAELSRVMAPDYIMSSSKEFIPRIIVEDFKRDSDYLETYAYRTAQLWNATPDAPKCLYVNLWEGEIYRGRLLVVQYHRDFRLSDYRLAEVLTQRVLMLLSRKRLGADRTHRSMDDIVYDLLQNRPPEGQEVGHLLTMLRWNKADRLLCMCIRNQSEGYNTVLEHALHSDLFQVFPSAYILFSDQQQCVILNLSREPLSLPLLRHRLAPLCRDYCLYAGVSSPVNGVRELHFAYFQAEHALNCAFSERSARWILPFSDCALDYLLNNVHPPLQAAQLVSPELRRLIDHDRANGTQYFETLRAYLLHERDIPRTSEALIIHRTTLLYRLKKIDGIIHADLDDPWQRLYLILSLKILEDEAKG